MNLPKRKPPFVIRVTEHARERARERFANFKAARIIDDVREAFCDMRVSAMPPEGWNRGPAPECLYVWTEDGQRMYAVRAYENNMVVVTAVAPDLLRGAA